MKQFPHANIAIVVPKDVICLDVDHYGEKTGGYTLKRLESDYGPLPVTHVTSSRGADNVSGIRWFRIPRARIGADWPIDLGRESSIDVVSWCSKYAIVPPSVHKSGRVYQWYLDGEAARPPKPDELPLLPEDWCDYMTSLRARNKGGQTPYRGGTVGWLNANGGGPMCGFMEEMAPRWLDRVKNGDSANNEIWKVTANAVMSVREGHHGVSAALAPVRAAYIDRVCSRPSHERKRSEAVAVGEWRRALDGAVGKYGGFIAPTDEVCDDAEGYF
jgi:hypothetical protein